MVDDITLDILAGDWRIFQLRTGHRFSADDLLTPTEVKELLRKRHLMIEDTLELEGEFLR